VTGDRLIQRFQNLYCTPAAFAAQMRMLADSGYHTISPDQLYSYLISGTRLPVKPILLSFDDTDRINTQWFFRK
jgi:hypothetical protein